MGVREYGQKDSSRKMICVHGLTRNNHDFFHFASALQTDWHIACPDVVGRGGSSWFENTQNYSYQNYSQDMGSLISWMDSDSIDWVGTSMGGMLGMMLAARKNSPIRKLVLNDIGPFLAKECVARIRGYLGKAETFPDLDAAETYIRALYPGFGKLSPEHWREITEHSTRKTESGNYTMAYDPGIGDRTKNSEAQDVVMWDIWDKISCPIFVLRGETSDALLPETLAEMKRRRPDLEYLEIPGTGHVPPLIQTEYIQHIKKWLLSGHGGQVK